MRFPERGPNMFASKRIAPTQSRSMSIPNGNAILIEKHLAEWECSNLDPDSYMGKAKASAIPKLIAEVSRSDDAIREDMRAIANAWTPKYFAAESEVA